MTEGKMSLATAFALRPDRFRMLEKGICNAGWKGQQLSLLEIGCSKGDAAAFLVGENDYKITAIDISQDLIDQSVKEHGLTLNTGKLEYICADAEILPFAGEIYDGIYCEAAFSPIPDKQKVADEFNRVLKSGGRVLINDFAICRETGQDLRAEVEHIPCFAGVQTAEYYSDLLEKAGFETVFCREDYGELIRISVWLCKIFNISITEIGSYLSSYFHMGGSKSKVSCGGASKGAFFKKSKLTYCQMVFEKK